MLVPDVSDESGAISKLRHIICDFSVDVAYHVLQIDMVGATTNLLQVDHCLEFAWPIRPNIVEPLDTGLSVLPCSSWFVSCWTRCLMLPLLRALCQPAKYKEFPSLDVYAPSPHRGKSS